VVLEIRVLLLSQVIQSLLMVAVVVMVVVMLEPLLT
tara:strand:+ start:127 stop:234 length:108 start_codon:yes stop_codon:yes gene_type:complete